MELIALTGGKKKEPLAVQASGSADSSLCGDLFEFVAGHQSPRRPIADFHDQQPVVGIDELQKVVADLNHRIGKLHCPLRK
jgi:hypothetical protein